MISRRKFLWLGAVAGGVAVVLHARAADGPLDSLDRNSYIHHMTLHAHHFPGENRPGKMQMMAFGERRYLFQLVFHSDTWDWLRAAGQIVDVTDPLKPVVVNTNAFRAFSIQVAFNQAAAKWVLMTSEELAPGPSLSMPGLRGVRFYDVTDPTKVTVIAEYPTDGGDPGRRVQQGSGTHRDWYDGGHYAYLGAAPGDEFLLPPDKKRPERYRRSLQIIDVSDLAHPRRVSQWWVPGQRVDEGEAREAWRSKGDPWAYDLLHGPVYVPRRVEEGGRYAYSGWGTFGLLIHDVSDPVHPKLVGRWDTDEYVPGPMIPHHTVDVTRLDRGFVITSPESILTECREPWHDTWVVDVTDPTGSRALSKLPVPQPPPEAPYASFCQKRGRFGVHNAPHLKAPGRPHPNFTCYTYFNGGLQCYDLADPRHPKISAYFVPPQAGTIDAPKTHERSADSVFIEWDRRLIWLGSSSGLHLLSSPELGEPVLRAMPVKEWSLPGLNRGHP